MIVWVKAAREAWEDETNATLTDRQGACQSTRTQPNTHAKKKTEQTHKEGKVKDPQKCMNVEYGGFPTKRFGHAFGALIVVSFCKFQGWHISEVC